MNFVHAVYLLLTARWATVARSVDCIRERHDPLRVLCDSIFCTFRYGTSPVDYFNFGFYDLGPTQRSRFASTAFMYRFHRTMNDPQEVAQVDDKALFRIRYHAFAPRSCDLPVQTPEEVAQVVAWIREMGGRHLVVKDPTGTTGTSVSFADFDPEGGYFEQRGRRESADRFLQRHACRGRIYIEERLEQHEALRRLSPSGLNTVRVVTVLRESEVDVIAAVLRISVYAEIDNFSAGNLAAEVDPLTGIVVGAARRKDAACSPVHEVHPVTGVPIRGFEIPRWDEVRATVERACMLTPRVRTVGWDVAITNEGVRIIEGNPKWNKDTPQIPSQRGIRERLERIR